MKANELRIGNWVDVESFNGHQGLTRMQFHFDLTRYIHLFKPIPLTPEVLEKCGFRNYEEVKWDTDAMLLMKNGEGYLYLANQRHVNIFYLHQLQNLYFALTNEELTLKP